MSIRTIARADAPTIVDALLTAVPTSLGMYHRRLCALVEAEAIPPVKGNMSSTQALITALATVQTTAHLTLLLVGWPKIPI